MTVFIDTFHQYSLGFSVYIYIYILIHYLMLFSYWDYTFLYESIKRFLLLHHVSREDRILMTFEDNQLKCNLYLLHYTYTIYIYCCDLEYYLCLGPVCITSILLEALGLELLLSSSSHSDVRLLTLYNTYYISISIPS